MSDPRTEAQARAMSALYEAMQSAGAYGRHRQAIEDAAQRLVAVARAEAVAAWLASPEAEEALARGLGSLPPIPDEFLLRKTWVESAWLPNARDYARAILAHLRGESDG